jgi:selenocysteine-specific elongation factor
MHVLATAGHVDHGKSAIVAALTGTHPDRLKEERAREMTIDLGFAWFDQADGEEIGIIDVPGHIDFIENMLAGMGGIEGVILVIAVDEGIMPQTREHLDIIDLLEIKKGVVILNKVDLIDDPVWVELIQDEITQAVAKTSLSGAKIIRFSSKTQEGLEELKNFLNIFSKETTSPPIINSPRLSVDRVFSLQGFGTVVTGTLLDGTFKVGDEIEVLPRKIIARIRGMQTHNKKITLAQAGNRTAINLGGIDKEEINRGDVIAKPGHLVPTRRLDVTVRLLDHKGISLKHDDHVRFFIGSAQRNARIRLLGNGTLAEGEEGFLQIETDEFVSAKNGDHFIIRKASPSITLGGGIVLDVHPQGRYKLRDEKKIEGLHLKLLGDPKKLILDQLTTACTAAQLSRKLELDITEISVRVQEMLTQREILKISNPMGNDNDAFLMRKDAWESILRQVITTLQDKHSLQAYRSGFRMEEIERVIKTGGIPFKIIIDHLSGEGKVVEHNHLIRLAHFLPALSSLQERNKEKAWQFLDTGPFTPPTPQQLRDILGQDLFSALLENGDLVKVSEDVVFRKNEFDQMREYVEALLESGQTVTVSGFRDRYATSRKFTLAFLEFLDRQKVTRRDGDGRVRY